MPRRPKQDKAGEHEKKGDALARRAKHAQALKEYRKALELEPGRRGIYDKLIAAHDKAPGEWDMEDFALSVSWAMEKQEQENPPIKQVHARLSPEWKKATELAFAIVQADDEEKRGGLIEELVGMGEPATRALIGFLLELKKSAARADEK